MYVLSLACSKSHQNLESQPCMYALPNSNKSKSRLLSGVFCRQKHASPPKSPRIPIKQSAICPDPPPAMFPLPESQNTNISRLRQRQVIHVARCRYTRAPSQFNTMQLFNRFDPSCNSS